jgi:hypothetical protein
MAKPLKRTVVPERIKKMPTQELVEQLVDVDDDESYSVGDFVASFLDTICKYNNRKHYQLTTGQRVKAEEILAEYEDRDDKEVTELEEREAEED